MSADACANRVAASFDTAYYNQRLDPNRTLSEVVRTKKVLYKSYLYYKDKDIAVSSQLQPFLKNFYNYPLKNRELVHTCGMFGHTQSNVL